MSRVDRRPDLSELPTLGYGELYGDPPLVTFVLNLMMCTVAASVIGLLFAIAEFALS